MEGELVDSLLNSTSRVGLGNRRKDRDSASWQPNSASQSGSYQSSSQTFSAQHSSSQPYETCLCVICSGLRSDALCSICVIVICHDYVWLCLVSSGLRSDAVGNDLVSSGLRSDAEGEALVGSGLRSDAVGKALVSSGLRSDAGGKAAVSSRLRSDAEGEALVWDVLFDACWRAGISVKKEASMNFLTDPHDGRFTLRPTDILVFGWIGGKHACVDLTGVSPIVGLGSRGFTAGHTALKAAACKVVKHKNACIEKQHVFVPFAFATFGFLAQRRWSSSIASNESCILIPYLWLVQKKVSRGLLLSMEPL
uniref:Uncharacterized protein n=1 Tax=Lactuca sativa TaxID=4236 RepID=A0A9R1VYM7_LACSA|nr:hypothetical protein LSAT_V11C400188880 [Lactuca sativa]